MSAPKRRLGRGLDVLLGERRPTSVDTNVERPASVAPGDVTAPRRDATEARGDSAAARKGGAGIAEADADSLGAAVATSTVAVAAAGLVEISIAAIRPNRQQPRQVFDAAGLAELEQSVRELGVLVPVLVRVVPTAHGTSYELIAGERRWRAAAAAGLVTIPAILRSMDDKTSLEVAIVENLQRRDLDPLEEAMGLQHLLEEYSFTQERLADRVGKSRPAIANALRLLGLSDAIKARLRRGSLSVGHARALLALPVETRESVAERIERDGLSVRAVERLGEHRATSKRPARVKSPDVEAAESRLRYRLGAPVAIVTGAKGGKIEIGFTSPSDLIRIVEALGGDVA